MKTIIKKSCLLLTLTLLSCSSSLLLSSWESEAYEKENLGKILVVTRSSDMDVRKAYEKRIADDLRAMNMNATEAYIAFPKLRKDGKRSEEEIKQIVSGFRKNGVETILLMSLKDKVEVEKGPTALSKGSVAPEKYKKFNVGFANIYSVNSMGYLNSTLPARKGTNDQPGDIVTLRSTTYVIECLFYDITKQENRQLLATYEISVEDPKTSDEVLTNFAKTLMKTIK